MVISDVEKRVRGRQHFICLKFNVHSRPALMNGSVEGFLNHFPISKVSEVLTEKL